MANEDIPGLTDIDLVHAKYQNRNRIYAANMALKNDVGNVKAQRTLQDASARQEAIENHINLRMMRNQGSGPSTTL